MWDKVAGAALILSATTWAGWQVAAGYARRPRHLRDLQTGLAILRTEIGFGTPLPAALRSAAGAVPEPIASIFREGAAQMGPLGGRRPGDALRKALLIGAERTALHGEDLAALMALAAVIGASGREDQARHLSLAQERLAGAEARAEADRVRYERVARYAGLLSGAALIFILM